MRRHSMLTLFGLLSLAVLSGCSKNLSPTTGTMNIQLTDAPGDFQAVNLVVTQVAVQHADGNGGWEVLSSQTRAVDLLKLRNGVFTTLGLSMVPAGHYNQMRLMLGAGSNVVIDNTMHPLRIPSSLQSGLKLGGTFDVPSQGNCDLVLDFDVARSIVADGDGGFSLKPVIRCVITSLPDAKPGAIHGAVAPSGVMASVFVLQNADTVASTMTASDGQFTVLLMPAGTYSLGVHPRAGYQDASVGNVVVSSGATTDVGTVSLTPIPPPPPTTGSIAGMVAPAGVATTVSAMGAAGMVAQVSVGPDGSFTLDGLPTGSYDVQFQPGAGYQASTLGGVSVVAGQTTNVGTVQLVPVPPPPPPPQPGSIVGTLMPPGVPTTVFVMQGSATVAQVDAQMNGSFSIAGLAAGTYTVVIHPQFDFTDTTLPGVVVNAGAATNLGTINL
jgi:hypothetical protein